MAVGPSVWQESNFFLLLLIALRGTTDSNPPERVRLSVFKSHVCWNHPVNAQILSAHMPRLLNFKQLDMGDVSHSDQKEMLLVFHLEDFASARPLNRYLCRYQSQSESTWPSIKGFLNYSSCRKKRWTDRGKEVKPYIFLFSFRQFCPPQILSPLRAGRLVWQRTAGMG